MFLLYSLHSTLSRIQRNIYSPNVNIANSHAWMDIHHIHSDTFRVRKSSNFQVLLYDLNKNLKCTDVSLTLFAILYEGGILSIDCFFSSWILFSIFTIKLELSPPIWVVWRKKNDVNHNISRADQNEDVQNFQFEKNKQILWGSSRWCRFNILVRKDDLKIHLADGKLSLTTQLPAAGNGRWPENAIIESDYVSSLKGIALAAHQKCSLQFVSKSNVLVHCHIIYPYLCVLCMYRSK